MRGRHKRGGGTTGQLEFSGVFIHSSLVCGFFRASSRCSDLSFCWLSRPLLIFSSTMSFGPDPSLCRRSLPSIFHHLLPRRTYVSFHHRRLCSLVFSSVRSTILDHDAVVAPQLGFVASLHRRFHIMAPSSSSLHHAFPSSSRRTYASHQLQV